MDNIIQKFKESKALFDAARSDEDGYKIMSKVTELINELCADFTSLDGGTLANIQIKLAGYSFYLADYIANLSQNSEILKLQIKEIKAKRWEEITEEIKAVEGKVKNREQIENVLTIETKELQNKQILYESLFYNYKLKLSAINDLLTAIVQQVASKKRELEQVKSIQ